MKIILVTGGARSGKSRFAERYAERYQQVLYVATAQVLDNEMERRVTLHKERRPAHWGSVEAWENPAAVLLEEGGRQECILFDCLSLYVSNMMLSSQAPSDVEERVIYMKEQFARLLAAAKQVSGTLIFVANEVGLGIVPDNAMAREYRDWAGLLNQEVAAIADEVYFTVSGLAVEMKKLAEACFNAEV
ncbi:bifunctional adenosylcobinamide kinase/adenosylcobinamide-phosphate guanylyltransferase [Azotosporobacter soli]|uniref:bifunctional adenosylcobinamide kinase/adenosylcobinamide-phosphate guanylyltransferase n=1 Tax=Azotosporobacter soli TaxID=3055040 RepID=UPI0031FEEAC3